MGRKKVLNEEAAFQKKVARTLQAMDEHHKGATFTDNSQEIVDVLIDESDRGAIILIGGVLEDVLSEKIIASLPKGVNCKKDLLRGAGPSGNFEKKLILAEALGIIQANDRESLQIIQRVRNACAHSLRVVNFTDPPLYHSLCLLMANQNPEELPEKEEASPYFRLVWASVMVYHIERIRGASMEAAQAAVDRIIARTKKAIREIEGK